jgi:hypothetical protein
LSQVIPAAFIKLYGNDVGKTAILQGPGGQVWQVGIGRPKWVAFRVGWWTFAADHDLEKGDILVFTLTGKSQFSVKIFDNKTGIEKLSVLEPRNTGIFDSRTSPVLGEKRKERDEKEMELQLQMKRLCFDIAEGGIMDENPPLQALESLCSGESKHAQDSSRGKAEALDSPGAQWNLNEPYLHEPSDHLCPADDEYGETITANQEIQLLAHDQLLQVKETDSDDVLRCQTLLGKLPHDAAGEDLNTNKELLKASNSNANEVKQDYSGVGPATRFASQRRPVVETLRDIMHTDVAYHQSFQARSTSNAQNVQPMINQAGELHREHDKVPRPLIP